MALSVRITDEDHAALKELAEQTSQPMSELLHVAITDLKRRHLLDETNRAYQKLRDDPKAWKEELAERRAWERASLTDLRKEL